MVEVHIKVIRIGGRVNCRTKGCRIRFTETSRIHPDTAQTSVCLAAFGGRTEEGIRDEPGNFSKENNL